MLACAPCFFLSDAHFFGAKATYGVFRYLQVPVDHLKTCFPSMCFGATLSASDWATVGADQANSTKLSLPSCLSTLMWIESMFNSTTSLAWMWSWLSASSYPINLETPGWLGVFIRAFIIPI